MTDEKKPTTRRELMRPAQLLGLAFIAAVFAGVVTAVSLGLFQGRGNASQNAQTVAHALIVGGIMAGIVFIVVLLGISMLLLAIKPADVTKTVDHPVLYDSDHKHDKHDKHDKQNGGSGASAP
ncbi:hypothetical protein [Microbacterium gorillae]|uniref:hypothetical protein n=1 Tax=Microbacterium gorillae TaxID=1231063 RepID=UPI00058E8804|nr:hypothetical protein [Microbacterium gorillae]